MTTTANTNDFGFLGAKTANEVKNMGGKSNFPKLALCRIKQAVINKSESGVVSLDIMLNVLNQDSKEIESTYRLDTMFLTGKDYTQNNYQKMAEDTINNLRFLLGVPEKTPFNVSLQPSEVWDKEQKKMVEKPVNNLTDIVGKLFYTVLVCYHRYPRKFVNGYTGVEITSWQSDPAQHQIERDLPETIEIYDQNSEKTIPTIAWRGFFDFNTKQTLKEKLEEKEPVTIDSTLEAENKKKEEGVFDLKKYTAEEMVEYRKKALEKRLGKSFDQSRWNSFNGVTQKASSSTPNW